MKLSTVLFDLDGTLTDPKVGITRCIRFSLGLLGASPPDEDRLEWCIGPPLKASFRCLLNTDDEALVELAINHYRSAFPRSAFLRMQSIRGSRIHSGESETPASSCCWPRPSRGSTPRVF